MSENNRELVVERIEIAGKTVLSVILVGEH